MMSRFASILLTAALLVGLTACSGGLPGGKRPLAAEERPPEQRGLVLVQHLDERVPMELRFTDQDGRRHELGDYFDGNKPVLLSFNYASCPMLCGMQLNGLADALEKMKLAPGRDFRILTVSLDPGQPPIAAKEQQETFWKRMLRPDVPKSGWQFLQGDQVTIQALTKAVGYPYRYLPDQNQYIHAPIYAVCTPDGRISSYFERINPDPQELRLFLVDASAGRIGGAIDQILMFCFHYDPEAGSFQASTMKLMSAGGVVILVVLGVFLWRMWRIDLRRQGETAESRA